MKKRVIFTLSLAILILFSASCDSGWGYIENSGELSHKSHYDETNSLLSTQKTQNLFERFKFLGNNGGKAVKTEDSKPLNSDYSKIYELIKERAEQDYLYYRDYNYEFEVFGDFAVSETNAPRAVAAESPEADFATGANSAENSKTFSDTNNQIEGIQEGDIVKTDGKNIYFASLHLNNVSVVKTDNGKMSKLATLKKEDATPVELLLYNKKLIVIWNKRVNDKANISDANRDYHHWGYRWKYETVVEIYDTNGNFKQPVSSYTQDGRYSSSRMIENIIYLITDYSPLLSVDFAVEDYDVYIPAYTLNGRRAYLGADCIVLPERLDNIQYTVISGLNVNKTDMLVSAEANLGGSNIIYSSFENIYITSWANQTINGFSENFTVINKFGVDKGQIKHAATGKVRGSIETQFYMDEYDGIFRVVTQVWGNGNNRRWDSQGGSLYALDKNLNILSEISGIGGDEMVQSVRFEKEIAYVVTFLLTDPLFAFDMSDPENPIMLSELKIPGFSRYLHKWSDNSLLGVGVEACEETGRRTGLKVSMFDVSDNEDLSERHVYIIDMENPNQNRYSWFYSIAERDHKAILVSPDKNIIAFPYNYEYSDYSGYADYSWGGGFAYVVFSYDERDGFTLMGEIRTDYNNLSYDYNIHNGHFQRGLYIGDFLYAVANDKIVSAKLGVKDIEIMQTLVF